MQTVTKMRLSKETLSILKNFANINSNILIKPGNKLKTISHGMNILAEATIQEEFDTTVPIFDLNQFLGVITMFNNPDLEFTDKYVDISNGRSTVRYFYSSIKLLTVPEKELPSPKPIIDFILDEHNLNEMLKAANILQVNDVEIVGEGGELKIVVSEATNTTSNNFSIVIDEKYDGPDYRGKLEVSDIKFLPGSYKVELTSGVISRFTHQTQNLVYYIAIDRR